MSAYDYMRSFASRKVVPVVVRPNAGFRIAFSGKLNSKPARPSRTSRTADVVKAEAEPAPVKVEHVQAPDASEPEALPVTQAQESPAPVEEAVVDEPAPVVHESRRQRRRRNKQRKLEQAQSQAQSQAEDTPENQLADMPFGG